MLADSAVAIVVGLQEMLMLVVAWAKRVNETAVIEAVLVWELGHSNICKYRSQASSLCL